MKSWIFNAGKSDILFWLSIVFATVLFVVFEIVFI